MATIGMDVDARNSPPPPAHPADLPHMPSSLVQEILLLLPPNEIAVHARLVAKEYRSLPGLVRLREPVPPTAFAEWVAHITGRCSRAERLVTFVLVCCSGVLENLETLLRARWPMSPRCYHAACAAGDVHVLRWLQLNGCAIDRDEERRLVLRTAASGGTLESLVWVARSLAEPGSLLDERVFVAAMQSRTQLQEKALWLLNNGCRWSIVSGRDWRGCARTLMMCVWMARWMGCITKDIQYPAA